MADETRGNLDQDFICKRTQGSEFSVRIKISKEIFQQCKKAGIYEKVDKILNQKPIFVLSGGEKGEGIKMEPGFYEFWTAKRTVLYTKNNPGPLRNGMVLEFKKVGTPRTHRG
jgi:hypothetical protein